jgi:serine phosphatase RsbU (regulator of sigma subunit)
VRVRLSRAFAEFARRRSLRDLVGALTLREVLPLAVAIFSLFAVLGTMTDVISGARLPGSQVLATCVFSGTIALFYAFGSLRRQWLWVVLAVVLQIAWVPFSARAFRGIPALAPEAVPERLKSDALLTLLLMAVTYSCFLWFINGTAARYLRARAEIELARQIHQVLVPAVSLTIGAFEFHGFSVPSGEVGGDLVDVVALGSLARSASSAGAAASPPDGARDAWFGYVADVSGHGVSSGVVMGMFKSALRMRLLQPGRLSSMLDDLNRVLFPLKSGSMFVTLACVRSNGPALEYAVAGHLPILRVSASTRQVEAITTPQIPIAMFEDFSFTSSALTCEPGDLLALITDGLTEVFDAGDRELGIERIEQILAASASRPLGEIADEILAAARAHGRQLDDQTLLLIRRA